MMCELCNQENPVSCDHGKNGYCLLFRQQAEKDVNLFGPKKTLADEVTENKNIVLHPDRVEIGKRLREENLSMLAWCIETGLSLTGYELTQIQYDENIDAAL